MRVRFSPPAPRPNLNNALLYEVHYYIDMSELNESYQKTTILFPLMENGIILGMKKQGFGVGWWNGFGGKLEQTETYEQAAIRETSEEVGIAVKSLLHVANLHFYFNDVLGVVSKAYTTKDFAGEPVETDEMRPSFFPIDKLPYDKMWPADKLWVPAALNVDALPLGFIVHFAEDKTLRSIEEVDPTNLESKF